jgi:hypothetical protein
MCEVGGGPAQARVLSQHGGIDPGLSSISKKSGRAFAAPGFETIQCMCLVRRALLNLI